MSQIYVFAAGNERGGAASHLVTLANAIRQSSTVHDYTFILSGAGPLSEKLQQIPGTDVVILDGGSRRVIQALRDRLKQAPPKSLLHAHGPRLNILAWLATRSIAFPWTSTIHSHIDKDFLSSRWKTRLFPKLNRLALRKTVGLFVVNPFFGTLVPEKKSLFVPNGLTIAELPEHRDVYRKRLRDRLQLPLSTKVIGTAARLDPVKDIQTMIQACTEPALRDVHLAIAGDGEQRQYLERLVQQLQLDARVHFLGFIDHVREFYAGLDAHVLSSLSEGTPFSILEAGFYGVPNVGSDIPGITQLVRHDETGVCFPVGHSAELAKQVFRVLNDDAFASKLVERFQSDILPQYTPTEMLTAYESGYSEWTRESSQDF